MSVLAVDPDAPWIIKAGADAILYLHIGGGAVGMVSGMVALAAPKGRGLHQLAGRTFVISMLIMAGIGAVVAPFLTTFLNESPNVIAGVMTFYLVLTSWLTVRRREPGVGLAEYLGFATAFTVALAGAAFIIAAMRSPTGTVGETPPQAFYLFLVIGSIAAASDLKVILNRGVAGPARLARHLWRMCAALGIASGSFFFGQSQLLPAWLRDSPIPALLVLAPVAAIAFWTVRVRLKRRPARAAPQAA